MALLSSGIVWQLTACEWRLSCDARIDATVQSMERSNQWNYSMQPHLKSWKSVDSGPTRPVRFVSTNRSRFDSFHVQWRSNKIIKKAVLILVRQFTFLRLPLNRDVSVQIKQAISIEWRKSKQNIHKLVYRSMVEVISKWIEIIRHTTNLSEIATVQLLCRMSSCWVNLALSSYHKNDRTVKGKCYFGRS